MQTTIDALTPDNLRLLHAIATHGSFATAARALGLAPSGLTWRVRQIEEALDVLLFDRSRRQARLTEAGRELLREGDRLLGEMDTVAQRVRRVATGWEPRFTLSVDGAVSRATMLELVEAFYALDAPTHLQWRDGTLTGTLEQLTDGRADLAIGVAVEAPPLADLRTAPLGDLRFVFAVAPHHPLATAREPLGDALLRAHRMVAGAIRRCASRPPMGCCLGRRCSPWTAWIPRFARNCAAWARATCPSRWRAPTSTRGCW